MIRDHELDLIKSKEEAAFRRKQEAFQAFAAAREQAKAAYEAMQSAWSKRCAAKAEMNQQFEVLQCLNTRRQEIWNEYNRIRDCNNYKIERLRAEADSEHREMQHCFERASDCYNYGDKSEAPSWSQQGREHKERRNALNEEVSRLCQEVKEARQYAEMQAPQTNSSAFRNAREVYLAAKQRHEFAQIEFKRLKSERDYFKIKFNTAKEEHSLLKQKFQNRLEEIKAKRQHKRNQILDLAGISISERTTAKIIEKADGTTQIYHGGLGSGDGFGHGHTVLTSFGSKVYDREAFAAHGKQNFTEEQEKDGWIGPFQGVILGEDRDYDVTFAQGTGINRGQTVIADGHLRKRDFHPRRRHNHYGPDVKYSDGTERIEDKGGDRGQYTGPGH